MKITFIFTSLFLFISCASTLKIITPNDYTKADKTKPFVYAKIQLKALKPFSNSELWVDDLFSKENLQSEKETNTCVLAVMRNYENLILGNYAQKTGKSTYTPRVLKLWEFNIPKEKEGFYYLGTITQDSQMSIVFEDGNKDECDAYVKTINPDFDPKTAIVLKPKRYVKEK